MMAVSVNMIWMGCWMMPELDQDRIDDAFIADDLLDREGADQEVGPEGNGDQEQPDVAVALGPRCDEIGGGEAEDQGDDGGREGELDRAPEDGDVGVGEGQRVVEYVALEENVEPGVGGERPFDAAVVALDEEGIDEHDQQRADGGEEDDEECGGGERPAVADFAALGGFGDFLGGRHGSVPQDLRGIALEGDADLFADREGGFAATAVLVADDELAAIVERHVIMRVGAEIDDV